MTTMANSPLKSMILNRTFVVGLIVLLSILIAIGYVCLQTDQVIAPPGLRIMDGLWRLFFFWK